MGTCTSRRFTRFEILVVTQATIIDGRLCYRGVFRVDRKCKIPQLRSLEVYRRVLGYFPRLFRGGSRGNLFSRYISIQHEYVLCSCRKDIISLHYTPPHKGGGVCCCGWRRDFLLFERHCGHQRTYSRDEARQIL
jgi:hypothetical protein